MKAYEKIFIERLKAKGLKLTKPRNLILEEVFKTHAHFNVDDLYDAIRRKQTNVSKPTVYRTIPLLLEAGLIKKSFTRNDKDYFEHIFGHKEHLHFICQKCGKVIELESKELEAKLSELAEERHFHIVDKNILIKGICSECS
jgi:Fur family ferric uptake transcriptional regulator